MTDQFTETWRRVRVFGKTMVQDTIPKGLLLSAGMRARSQMCTT